MDAREKLRAIVKKTKAQPTNGDAGKLNLRSMPVADLQPADYNPRMIDDETLNGLESSVEKFGLVEPIVWNERTNRVVGGHQRLKVLQRKGIEDTDVVVVDLDEQDERALNVTLNNPHMQGVFDQEKLEDVLKGLETDLPDVEFGELRLSDLNFSIGTIGDANGNSAIPDFQPVGIEEQSRLDEKKKVTCPDCGHEFTP